ncbi:MAG: LysR family transcriptional regulator, partial [Peptococcaceae bacterium]|nr:LysR family transcriptional regulator [Peptococcaceae bacterium]
KVAEMLSFSKAAKALYITQSTLSQQINYPVNNAVARRQNVKRTANRRNQCANTDNISCFH